MSTTEFAFDRRPILSYLGLLPEYVPAPDSSPVQFLVKHLQQLPQNLASRFSLITTPKQRTVIPAIRNRRLKYTESQPNELDFKSAKVNWPELWEGPGRRGQEEGKDEREWAANEFLPGEKKHVGKLGNILGDYEEEREAERARALRRERLAEDTFVPEEDSDSDSDDDEIATNYILDEESGEQTRALFERRIRERMIYGLLDSFDYDAVDWDEQLDVYDDREAEERWFDDDDDDD